MRHAGTSAVVQPGRAVTRSGEQVDPAAPVLNETLPMTE